MWSCDFYLSPFDLKTGAQVTRHAGTLHVNFGLSGLLCSRVTDRHRTDSQTDEQMGAMHTTTEGQTITNTTRNQYASPTRQCNTGRPRAEAILTKSCVVEGFQKRS